MAGWSSASLPMAAKWRAAAYGDGKFVAVALNSGNAAYSTDGISWTPTAMPSSREWSGVAFGANKFVAVAKDGYNPNIAYSSDGISWEALNILSGARLVDIAYGSGKFVAISGYYTNIASGSSISPSKSNVAAYSTDGINWEKITLPSSDSWVSIIYGNGKFVAVAFRSSSAIYSIDGINWYPVSLNYSYDWESVAAGNGKFVVVSSYIGTSQSKKAAYSSDGIEWVLSTLPYNADWSSVTYGNGKFLAIGGQSQKTAFTEDGSKWIAAPDLPSFAKWEDVVHGNGKFVSISAGANGTTGTRAAYISEDAIVSVKILLATSPNGGGTVSGAGEYFKGDTATVTATPANGWEFVAWTENGTTVSTSASYAFTVTANRNLTAVFKQKLTAWVGVANKARKGVKLNVSPNGQARNAVEAYIGVNGKARRFL